MKFFMTDEEAALAILKKTNFFAQVVKNQKIGASTVDSLQWLRVDCEKKCENLVNENRLPEKTKEGHTVYKELYKEERISNSYFFRWTASVIHFAEYNSPEEKYSQKVSYRK